MRCQLQAASAKGRGLTHLHAPTQPVQRVAARGMGPAPHLTDHLRQQASRNPDDDIMSGLRLLGPILKRFTSVSTTYEPVADGDADGCYISKSFDGTSHFESDVNDLLSLYRRVAGEDLDMNINADSVEGDY